MDTLENRLLLAYEDAIATKGKNKGKLKSKCPPMGTDGAAMWQSLMLYANPYKCGMFHLFMSSLDPEFKSACDKFAHDRAELLPRLDRDRVALESLGVW